MKGSYSDKSKQKPRPQNQTKRTEEKKIDSVFIARELVRGDGSQIALRLAQYKDLKNQNYEKFTQKITKNLQDSQYTFVRSCETFKNISLSANIQNTTGHQLGAILQGFINYWKTCYIIEPMDEIGPLFYFIPEVYVQINSKFVTACSQLIKKLCDSPQQQSFFKQKALKMVENMLNAAENHERILPIVYEFDLYEVFPLPKIAELVMNSRNPNEYLYIFQKIKGEIRYDLMDLFVGKCLQRDDTKKCETIIKKLEIDPFRFPALIEKLQQKNLYYQIRTNRLYFVELVVRGDRSLLKILVKILKREGRNREVKYFVLKYGLNEKEYNIKFSSNSERDQIKSIVNVLEVADRFGPTEIEVLLQRQENSFIYLREFGFDEEDVTFVDRSNIDQITSHNSFKKRIGFDSETCGGVHVFDLPKMSIIQIFSGSQIFIFDYLDLKQNDRFKQIMVYLFTNCKIYGHDHQKQLTIIQRELQLDIKEEIMQQLMRDRVIDTNKLHKKLNPKDSKSNLVHICEVMMRKPISKFEQCSAWAERPLRKAQLHYASLDCVLPLKLGLLMENQLNPKK